MTRCDLPNCSVLLTFAVHPWLAPISPAQSSVNHYLSTCHGYWDTLSLMVLDPGLNGSYHLEGTSDRRRCLQTTDVETRPKKVYTQKQTVFPWASSDYPSIVISGNQVTLIGSDPHTTQEIY